MDPTLRILILAAGAFIFYRVTVKLIKHEMSESNSVMWFLIGVLTLVSGIFPDVFTWAAQRLGIGYPPALVFSAAIIALVLITYQTAVHLSRAESKIDEIAITLSILKEENRRLTETPEREPPLQEGEL